MFAHVKQQPHQASLLFATVRKGQSQGVLAIDEKRDNIVSSFPMFAN